MINCNWQKLSERICVCCQLDTMWLLGWNAVNRFWLLGSKLAIFIFYSQQKKLTDILGWVDAIIWDPLIQEYLWAVASPYACHAMLMLPLQNVCHRKINVAIFCGCQMRLRCVCPRPSSYCHDCPRPRGHTSFLAQQDLTYIPLVMGYILMRNSLNGLLNIGLQTDQKYIYFHGHQLWSELWDKGPSWTAFSAELSAFFFSPKVQWWQTMKKIFIPFSF